jgi:hypothetical protein
MFVEAHPEAIAELLGVVRQTVRALLAEGLLAAGSPAIRALEEVDDLLWMALGAAVHETADRPFPPELDASLGALPARLRALEAVLSDTGAADVPVSVAVHLDVPGARVLEEATGRIEEAWIAMREAGTHRIWLALGASIPRFELVLPASGRLTDDAWRARLEREGEPPPGALARAYVLPAPERAPSSPAAPPAVGTAASGAPAAVDPRGALAPAAVDAGEEGH